VQRARAVLAQVRAPAVERRDDERPARGRALERQEEPSVRAVEDVGCDGTCARRLEIGEGVGVVLRAADAAAVANQAEIEAIDASFSRRDGERDVGDRRVGPFGEQPARGEPLEQCAQLADVAIDAGARRGERDAVDVARPVGVHQQLTHARIELQRRTAARVEQHDDLLHAAALERDAMSAQRGVLGEPRPVRNDHSAPRSPRKRA